MATNTAGAQMVLPVQQIINALPRRLRRHKVVRGLVLLSPMSRVQLIRFNGSADAYVDLSHGNSRTTMLTGWFEPHYFEIARSFLADGAHTFDVGANMGLCSFGLIPHRRGLHHHLFEANPELWPVLRRSIAHHAGESIQLVEGAVGAHAAERIFVDTRNPDQDVGQGFISEQQGLPTKMLTLDAYVERAGVARVDFMKMDIEGYEMFALEGAGKSIAAGRFPVVYFELKEGLLARFGKTASDVLAFFRTRGYELFHVRPEDFAARVTIPTLQINGVPAAPVGTYPQGLGTDLLAVHESARHVVITK